MRRTATRPAHSFRVRRRIAELRRGKGNGSLPVHAPAASAPAVPAQEDGLQHARRPPPAPCPRSRAGRCRGPRGSTSPTLTPGLDRDAVRQQAAHAARRSARHAGRRRRPRHVCPAITIVADARMRRGSGPAPGARSTRVSVCPSTAARHDGVGLRRPVPEDAAEVGPALGLDHRVDVVAGHEPGAEADHERAASARVVPRFRLAMRPSTTTCGPQARRGAVPRDRRRPARKPPRPPSTASDGRRAGPRTPSTTPSPREHGLRERRPAAARRAAASRSSTTTGKPDRKSRRAAADAISPPPRTTTRAAASIADATGRP